MRTYILIFFLIVVFASCEKTAGPGGTSSIRGSVWVQNYTSDFKYMTSEHWAEEEDVYIIYGNDSIYSDRTKTNYDGSYWFQFLHEGTYTIYVYTEDSSFVSASGRIPIMREVTISDAGTDVIIPKITILD